MRKMFSGERYLTRGIQNQVDISLQLKLWEMIENLECELDYLQVFVLEKVKGNRVRITHSQEVPEYTNVTMHFGEMERDRTKIFVIDDVAHSTMLLASEY